MCNRLDRTLLFARQKKRPAAKNGPRMPAYLFSNNSTSLYRDPASDLKPRHESVSTVQQNIRCLVFCCWYTMCSHNVKLCTTGTVCDSWCWQEIARRATRGHLHIYDMRTILIRRCFVYSSCYQHRRIAGKAVMFERNVLNCDQTNQIKPN